MVLPLIGLLCGAVLLSLATIRGVWHHSVAEYTRPKRMIRAVFWFVGMVLILLGLFPVLTR